MVDKDSLSDDDKIALLALITRAMRNYTQYAVDVKAKAEIDVRIKAARKHFEQVRNAFLIFGFDVTKRGGWDEVADAVGLAEYETALERGQVPGWAPEEQDAETGEPADETSKAPAVAALADEQGGSQTVRELVLASLKAAAPGGRKAADIRREIELRRGTKLHDKTIGMTLYRLSQADPPHARRDGITWFYVPSAAADSVTQEDDE